MVKTSGPRPVKAIISVPTRALATEYQNTTGRPLLVIASVIVDHTDVTGDLYVQARAGPSSPLGSDDYQSAIGFMGKAGTALVKAVFNVAFAVTPGYYYSVVTTGSPAYGSFLLSKWVEIEL